MADNRAVILLGRIALIALVLGTATSVTATERIGVLSVASGFVGWLFVPLLQLITGLVLVRGAAIPTLAALEAYFATHWPWSIWTLAYAAMMLVPAAREYQLWLLASGILPGLMTIRLLRAVCTDRLHLSVRDARRRTRLHQTITLTLILVYFAFAVALWPRVVSVGQ